MTDVRSFDGTRLALTTWGPEDAPLVVLVHGLGLSSEGWGAVPAALAGRHRVVAYDLRGHAQSGDARSGGYTLEAHARDLDAVLDACAVEGRPVLAAGHSLGGAILLAHRSLVGDRRLTGAVLVGSGGSAVTFPGLAVRRLPAAAEARLRTAWFHLLRAGAVAGRRLRRVQWLSDRLMRHFAFADDAPPDVVAQVRDSFLGTRPLAMAGTTLASVRQDGTELAPDFDVPTLVVHGTRDPEVPEDDLRRLMSRLPDGELVQVPAAGHMLPLTHGDLVAEQISRWVPRAG